MANAILNFHFDYLNTSLLENISVWQVLSIQYCLIWLQANIEVFALIVRQIEF